ncbi:unnamed protein product [Calypogeia fissa]
MVEWGKVGRLVVSVLGGLVSGLGRMLMRLGGWIDGWVSGVEGDGGPRRARPRRVGVRNDGEAQQESAEEVKSDEVVGEDNGLTEESQGQVRTRQDRVPPVPAARYFTEMTKKQKYYALIRGFIPGVYDSWQGCEPQVKGYSGQIFTSFKTRAEAERCYAEGIERAEIHELYGHQFVSMGRDVRGVEIFRCEYCLVTHRCAREMQ